MYNVQLLVLLPILLFGMWLFFTDMFEGDIAGIDTEIVLLFGLVAFSKGADGNHPMENEGLFEGDIAGVDFDSDDRNAVVDNAELWPGGVIPYRIDYKLRHIEDILQEAMKEYEDKTCLKFVKTTFTTRDYIEFTIVTGCWSSVGRKGGMQEISLSEGCHDKVSAVHEIGHAIGLWHEHSRSDRDEYLEILWENIKPGSEQNFLKLKPYENNLLGEEFDYKSIMLYGEYAFSKDRKSMTMKPKKEGVVIGLINDKPGLSDSDVRRINRLYECFGNIRPPPPEVPDFNCDFEVDMCGFEGQNNNAEWKRTHGILGGRESSYLAINASEASFRRVRLVTPPFGRYGRNNSCLRFEIFFNGNGVLSLNIMVHDVRTSTLLMKHVDRKDEWQKFAMNIDLVGDVKVSFDAYTRKSDGDGIIALDNVIFQWKKCPI